jgi:hypothetical protein
MSYAASARRWHHGGTDEEKGVALRPSTSAVASRAESTPAELGVGRPDPRNIVHIQQVFASASKKKLGHAEEPLEQYLHQIHPVVATDFGVVWVTSLLIFLGDGRLHLGKGLARVAAPTTVPSLLFDDLQFRHHEKVACTNLSCCHWSIVPIDVCRDCVICLRDGTNNTVAPLVSATM